MNNPFANIILVVILVVCAVVVATYEHVPARTVNCDLVEFHPDLVKYREQCRQMRGSR